MKARYFCENCGAEVRSGASHCPSCGRTFTAVRCPQCGFEGTSAAFSRGCPSCGYMEEKKAVQGSASPASRPVKRPTRRTYSARFYRVAGFVLLGLVAALVTLRHRSNISRLLAGTEHAFRK